MLYYYYYYYRQEAPFFMRLESSLRTLSGDPKKKK
jgi:hypothetical protein